ncbi:MAG: glutamate--tRNA ligase [Chloroflexi bacterium]|nr:glutamate--tRNA ligase [Chloroflexota bacterium]
MENIRVRFAPSPTGYLHIGGARTALFNWLFARSTGGRFILRIEDTDIKRGLEDSEKKIIDDLKWLGLDWDEGPDKGGEYGPYRQTERLELYNSKVNYLLEKGLAYKCYCTEEELKARREEALARKETPRYDGRCRDLTEEEQARLSGEGREPTIRFKVPPGVIVINDMVKGEVSFDAGLIGDFVLMKSNGIPSYNFAVVVDDSGMKISHVMRGDEHLINTPRQVMLFVALGEKPPEYGHVSMILAPDHTKLSKRHGTTSVSEFRDQGYHPAALVNYLALLGWSPPGDREIFTLQELVENFDPARLAKNPAIYDKIKLTWLSGQYIKNEPAEKIFESCAPYIAASGLMSGQELEARRDFIISAIELVKDGLNTYEDSVKLLRPLISPPGEFTPEAENAVKEGAALLKSLIEKLSGLGTMDAEKFKLILSELKNETGFKGKQLYMPIRSALIGEVHGPDLAASAALLGPYEIKKRVVSALERFVS